MVIASHFEDNREEDEPFYDQESLHKTFDKLSACNTRTGYPSCPEEVWKAKHAAREIMGRARAGDVR